MVSRARLLIALVLGALVVALVNAWLMRVESDAADRRVAAQISRLEDARIDPLARAVGVDGMAIVAVEESIPFTADDFDQDRARQVQLGHGAEHATTVLLGVSVVPPMNNMIAETISFSIGHWPDAGLYSSQLRVKYRLTGTPQAGVLRVVMVWARKRVG